MKLNPELIIQLEDASDRLDHTNYCITVFLVNNKPCSCGLEDIRANVAKFKNSHWREQHEYDNIRS